MSDAQIFALLDELAEAPSLTVGRWRYHYVPGRIVTSQRIGKGERWALSPSRGVSSVAVFLRGVHLREVRNWVERAVLMDFSAHAHAMAAHTL